ncbi:MAG: TlpA family protein disulfide reductase [Actinomycetota bacterium]|nr:TlpA family protein disulfide reductase [Actinomycetota bacterium]
MRRLTAPIVAGLAALALVALLAYGMVGTGEDTTLDEAVRRGDRPPAPDLSLPVLGTGSAQALSDLRGEVVVLNFWASWCDPCKEEAPVLERAHQRLRAEGAGTVLGVTFRDASPASMRFVREQRLSYPSVRDVDGELAERFGTRSLPETFVIDREGRIAAVARGQLDQATIDRALDEVL